MKNCHKLEHDVSGWNYNTQHSGVSRMGIRLRVGEDWHFRLHSWLILHKSINDDFYFPTLCITA